MHRREIDGTVFFYHGDFSGEVEIQSPLGDCIELSAAVLRQFIVERLLAEAGVEGSGNHPTPLQQAAQQSLALNAKLATGYEYCSLPLALVAPILDAREKPADSYLADDADSQAVARLRNEGWRMHCIQDNLVIYERAYARLTRSATI